jgi:hypothetical protein
MNSLHDFPPNAWRCTHCGALVGSIDAKLRCPKEVSTPPPASVGDEDLGLNDPRFGCY